MSLETCQIYSRKRQFYTEGIWKEKKINNFYTMHKKRHITTVKVNFINNISKIIITITVSKENVT
jgi:hypothetical protein